MSYILEALKKSQREHARGRVPTLELAPPPLGEPLRPRWIPLLSAMAVGALAAAAGALHFSTAPDRPTSVAEIPATPAPSPATPAKALTAPRERAPAEPVATPAVEPRKESRAPAAPPAPRPASAKPAPIPAPAVALPSFAWHQLPDSVRNATGRLTLNIHVYGDDPARRFAFINGRQYREGETLREGPLLEHIVPTGVVLAFQTERFRLDVPK